MKINGNTIKPGMVLQVNGGLWVVTKASHVKPGKGGAFAQVELRNLREWFELMNEPYGWWYRANDNSAAAYARLAKDAAIAIKAANPDEHIVETSTQNNGSSLLIDLGTGSGAIALALILVIGTPAAYLLATRSFPGRAVVITLVELPLGDVA